MLNFKKINLKNLKIKNFRDNRLGYSGEIGVILVNLSNEPYTVQPGDRIAQLVFAKVIQCDGFEGVLEFKAAEDNDRGLNGYGSTGLQ